MTPPRNVAGFTLLEALVAIFFTSVALLAAAPLFVHASHATDASADMGAVGAIALDRMEQLRQELWRNLGTGGSLTSNVTGYFDDSDPDFLVRWEVSDNASPSQTKTITVLVLPLTDQRGPRRSVEITSMRGR
jgi:type II secretory pathway pseudopilin PulG